MTASRSGDAWQCGCPKIVLFYSLAATRYILKVMCSIVVWMLCRISFIDAAKGKEEKVSMSGIPGGAPKEPIDIKIPAGKYT